MAAKVGLAAHFLGRVQKKVGNLPECSGHGVYAERGDKCNRLEYWKSRACRKGIPINDLDSRALKQDKPNAGLCDCAKVSECVGVEVLSITLPEKRAGPQILETDRRFVSGVCLLKPPLIEEKRGRVEKTACFGSHFATG